MELKGSSADRVTNHASVWDEVWLRPPRDLGQSNKRWIEETFAQMFPCGDVLEAMCGGVSYWSEPRVYGKVTALDFSPVALEKYPFADRPRVLGDLDRLASKAEEIDVLQPKSFDYVSICFGWRYLRNPLKVYHYLRTLIRPEGGIVHVESEFAGITDGFQQLGYQKFDPELIKRNLKEAGFHSVGSVTRDDSFKTCIIWGAT